jgi:hypothetical protein
LPRVNQRTIQVRPAAIAAIVFLCAGSASRLTAQLNLLTAREAKELVELVPDVAAAKARGECPGLDLDALENPAENFSFEARGACWGPGAPMSMLIGNYTVDRKTGMVTNLGSQTVISTPAMRERAKVFVDLAGSRLLSESECRCLAVKSAKAGFSGSAQAFSFSVSDLTSISATRLSFVVSAIDEKAQESINTRFSVSRETGSVMDDDTATEVLSPDVAALRAKMLSQRTAPALSLLDALNVALRVPAIRAKLSPACAQAEVSGNDTANGVLIVINRQCPGAFGQAEWVASVNVLTGVISDPRTGARIPSPEADQIAQEIFSRMRNARSEDRRIIDRECSGIKPQ